MIAATPAIEFPVATTQFTGTTIINALTDRRSRVLARVAELKNLQSGWDGYGSPTIATLAMESATQIAMAIPESSIHFLSIVPLSGGGIQFEWHARRWDAEIEIRPDGTRLFAFEVENEPPVAGPLFGDIFDPLIGVLDRASRLFTPELTAAT